jgi:uncharacterized protein YqfB (UPF0267 family)
MDVDTDRMADALRRITDGLETNDVDITATSTTTDIPDAEDLAEHGFSLRYHTTHEYEDVVDVIRYATDAYLRFKDEYIAPILRGDKTTTVRYGLEREFNPGTEVALIDEDDDTFAEATVEAYIDLPIRRVCDFGMGRHESGDDNVADLVLTLRELYDDNTIDAESYVTVILFIGVEPNDDYPTENYV